MPIVNITLTEGRKNEDIENCMRNVALAVHQSLNTPVEKVLVTVNEIPTNRLSKGTKLRSEL